LRVVLPDLLVDIGGLQELKELAATPNSIRIGALTTHAAIEDGKLPDAFGGLMQAVASKISYRAVRNHGTIGGSVALADPAADWPGCLMALGAQVRISGLKGVRSQPIGNFVQGQYATSLAPDEIILGFDLPRPDATLRWGFFKVVRKSGAFANSIAFAVAHGRGGPVSVVLGAAAARACSLPTVAEHIKAGRSDESVRAAIAEDVAAQLPADDPYLARLHTSTVLRAVREMQSK
jgi:aerobic carbon-monoxide dehydrogenase medium subunit